jgi:anti-sigma regulatory factor (Ser/Thr protein kinase)
MRGFGHEAVLDGFRHEALFYSGQEEFLTAATAFVRGGVEGDEPVLAVLNGSKIDALRSELRDEADEVAFVDMSEVGGNPARIIPAWREFVAGRASPARRMRGIGEPICAERTPAELVECHRHEALINLAFADAEGFHLLCPYDTETLSPDVLEEAKRNHPFVDVDQSDDYRGLEDVAAPFAEPLPDPLGQPESSGFEAGTLRALRRFVAAHATDAGLDARGTEDLVLAVDEVATNSVVHGGGEGVLRIWPENGALICEVHDNGRIDKPLAGRERPAPGQPGGHGLWMANELCDLVQIRTFTQGSVVRLHKRRNGGPG